MNEIIENFDFSSRLVAGTTCDATCGEIRYHFWNRYPIPPTAGKFETVSKSGVKFPHI